MSLFGTVAPIFPEYAPPGADRDMDDWSCDQLRLYWNNIKAGLGNTDGSRASFEAEMARLGFFADCRTVSPGSCAFKQALAKDGFDVELGLISGVLCDISETAETVTETAARTANVLKFLVPAVLIGGTLYVVANSKRIFKTFKR